MLLGGCIHEEVATAVGICRTTVTKWANYAPLFIGELNRRRQQTWAAATEKLRSLVPRALAALERELDRGAGAGRVALELLKVAGVGQVQPEPGPAEADEVLAQRIRRRAEAAAFERVRGAFPAGMVPLDLAEPTERDLKQAEEETRAEVEDAWAADHEQPAADQGGKQAPRAS